LEGRGRDRQKNDGVEAYECIRGEVQRRDKEGEGEGGLERRRWDDG